MNIVCFGIAGSVFFISLQVLETHDDRSAAVVAKHTQHSVATQRRTYDDFMSPIVSAEAADFIRAVVKWKRAASMKIYKLHTTIDSDEEVPPNPNCVLQVIYGELCMYLGVWWSGRTLVEGRRTQLCVLYYDVLYCYIYAMVDTGDPMEGFFGIC